MTNLSPLSHVSASRFRRVNRRPLGDEPGSKISRLCFSSASLLAPKLTSKASGKSPDSHFQKGEEYRHSPVLAFEILDSGKITHSILKSTSAVVEAVKYAPKNISATFHCCDEAAFSNA